MRRLVVIVVFLASAPVFCCHAQTNPDKQPSAELNIVSTVDEVALDVLVRNKKNKTVPDLKPEDLAVTDGGRPVKISELRLITGKSASERLISLVFDRMDSVGSANARHIVTKILKTISHDGFSFCVMRIEGHLTVVQEFTSDRQSLIHSISLATAATEAGNNGMLAKEKRLVQPLKSGVDSSSGVGAVQPGLEQVTRNAVEESQRILQEQHMSPALAGLLALARSQSKLPGRKIAIYFAQGLNVSTSAREALATIVGAAHRANLSIYTVDVNALNRQSDQSLEATMAMGNAMSSRASRVSAPQPLTGPPPPHAIGDLTTPGMQTMAADQFQRFEFTDAGGKSGPLADLAAGSGGAYIPEGANPQRPIRKMVEDMTNYYEISYVPPRQEYNGEFRSVSVKSLRLGLKVQSKAGYFALPPDEEMGIRPFEAALLRMFSESKLPEGLTLHADVLRLGELTNGNSSVLAIEMPISALAMHDDANTGEYSLHVSVVAQIKDRAGKVLQHFSEDVLRRGALDAKQQALSQVITVQRHFVADAGEYTLEAAALDNNSGKTGATRSTFRIPESVGGASLSDLILVRKMDPFPEDTDPGEPLRYGDRKVVPSLATQFATSPQDLSLFSLIHTDPHLNSQPRLEMRVMKDGEPVAQVPLQLAKIDAAGVIPYVASIRSAALHPGNYQIVETLTQGEKVVEQSRALRIEGANSSSVDSPAAANVEGTSASELPSGADASDRAPLVITPLPTALPPPSAQELQAIVEGTRNYAIHYSAALPNFLCVEVTSRSVDHSGNGDWKHRDTIAELLTFVDNHEERKMLERDGQRTSLQRSDLDSTWPISVGEFGAFLSLVFQPSSKTDFQWKEAAALGKDTVYVLNYRVARQNATIGLSDDTTTVSVGFHGEVYIDSTTRTVRRITLEADDLPRDFSIHAASMTVDYDYIAIGKHDYMMPVRAAVALRRGRRQIDLNEIGFRNYRRFAAASKVLLLQ